VGVHLFLAAASRMLPRTIAVDPTPRWEAVRRSAGCKQRWWERQLARSGFTWRGAAEPSACGWIERTAGGIVSESDPRVRRYLTAVAGGHRLDVDEGLRRAMAGREKGPGRGRVLVALLALEVAAAGIGLAVWALLPHKAPPRPANRPTVAVAPTGEIAFTVDSPDGSDFDIWVMNADGTNAHGLAIGPERDSEPAWSPDGTQIALVRSPPIPPSHVISGGGEAIFVVNANGTGLRRLTQPPHDAVDDEPAWSPDGSAIVFRSNRGGNFNIWLMDADGMDLRRITDGSYDAEPTWSPDGSQIAFVRYSGDVVTGSLDVWVVNSDGTGQPRRLTSSDVDGVGLKWSPDGSRLLFTNCEYGHGCDVWVMNSDGSDQHAVTHFEVIGAEAVWSPDGEWIAFDITRFKRPGEQGESSDQSSIYVMRADGSEVTHLTGSWFGQAHLGSWAPGT
jgi:Tol biopolymer transport system component